MWRVAASGKALCAVGVRSVGRGIASSADAAAGMASSSSRCARGGMRRIRREAVNRPFLLSSTPLPRMQRCPTQTVCAFATDVSSARAAETKGVSAPIDDVASIKASVQASCISCADDLEGVIERARDAARESADNSGNPLKRMRALLSISRRVQEDFFAPSSRATGLLLHPSSPRRMEHKMKTQIAVEATNQLKVDLSRLILKTSSADPQLDPKTAEEKQSADVASAVEQFFASYEALVWELRYMADNDRVVDAVVGSTSSDGDSHAQQHAQTAWPRSEGKLTSIQRALEDTSYDEGEAAFKASMVGKDADPDYLDDFIVKRQMEQLRGHTDRVDAQKWMQQLDRRTARVARFAYEDAKEKARALSKEEGSYLAAAERDTWNSILGASSGDFSEVFLGKLLGACRQRTLTAQKSKVFPTMQMGIKSTFTARSSSRPSAEPYDRLYGARAQSGSPEGVRRGWTRLASLRETSRPDSSMKRYLCAAYETTRECSSRRLMRATMMSSRSTSVSCE